jgi:predicted N-acetyltransferase YhbS
MLAAYCIFYKLVVIMDIILQQNSDDDQVEDLLDIAFGVDRHDKASYTLRRNVDAIDSLSFIVKNRSSLIATLRFWPALVKDEPLLLLGPIAVLPELQGQGIGIKLMLHGLMEATRQGHKRVLLVGDESYYKKVGFSRDVVKDIVLKGEADQNRLLGQELIKGSLRGLKGTLKNISG